VNRALKVRADFFARFQRANWITFSIQTFHVWLPSVCRRRGENPFCGTQTCGGLLVDARHRPHVRQHYKFAGNAASCRPQATGSFKVRLNLIPKTSRHSTTAGRMPALPALMRFSKVRKICDENFQCQKAIRKRSTRLVKNLRPRF
jgi:hypothetical protein